MNIAERFAAAVGAANAGDFGPFTDLWNEDCVWIDGGGGATSERHEGREASVAWFKQMMGDRGITAQPVDMLADEDHFVFFVRLTGERNGLTLDQTHANAWKLKDGRFAEGYFLCDDPVAWAAYIA